MFASEMNHMALGYLSDFGQGVDEELREGLFTKCDLVSFRPIDVATGASDHCAAELSMILKSFPCLGK